MPGRMDCAAVVLGSAVDVSSRRDRLAADRGAAERSVEVRMFMRNGDQLRCLAALSLGLGDRFLIEADLGAGGEEHELHARLGHRRDDGLAVVRNGDIHPLAALVTAAAGMVHEVYPLPLIGRRCDQSNLLMRSMFGNECRSRPIYIEPLRSGVPPPSKLT